MHRYYKQYAYVSGAVHYPVRYLSEVVAGICHRYEYILKVHFSNTF